MDHKRDSTEHRPSVADILQLKKFLLSKLPMEIIERIIDEASYWASSSVYLEHPSNPRIRNDEETGEYLMYLRSFPLGISGTEGDLSLFEKDFGDGGAAWTKKLRMGCPEDSLPMTSRPCRKIVFQLWCHNDLAAKYPLNFSNSYAWFDVVIEKLQTPIFPHDSVDWPAQFFFEEISSNTARSFLPFDRISQKMVAMTRSAEHHTIAWDFRDSSNTAATVTSTTEWNFLDGPFDKDLARATAVAQLVRSLRTGDCIALRARARFPRSENLQKAKITVYWAV